MIYQLICDLLEKRLAHMLLRIAIVCSESEKRGSLTATHISAGEGPLHNVIDSNHVTISSFEGVKSYEASGYVEVIGTERNFV